MHTVLKTAELKMHSHFEKKGKSKELKCTTRLTEIKQRLKVLYSPLKDEVIKKVPPANPPLSDMDPTLTYCGVEDLVTTTLPR